MTTFFSIIIPVYNRPEELNELLESLLNTINQPSSKHPSGNNTVHERPAGSENQSGLKKPDTGPDFEVIVVEDGSEISSKEVCSRYNNRLDLKYIYQNNAGPGTARNNGARSAHGDWLIFFDSDCIIPDGYFETVSDALNYNIPKQKQNVLDSRNGYFDVFGGPDRSSDQFTSTQMAIDYAMTSFYTTGGIRGGRRQLDRYYPRSFNMGVRKEAFESVGGFSSLRFGEDLDLSMRLMKAGYHSRLLEKAWVYHKRRIDFIKFYKQVYNSGMARIVLNRLHPGTVKTVHLLPALFVIYLLLSLFSIPFISGLPWYPVGFYLLLLFSDGLRASGRISAALLVPPASIVQLTGYGTGLLHALVLVHLLGKKDPQAFIHTFYK
ncbi:MAG: glycosyltransferase [Balneolales bacterium]